MNERSESISGSIKRVIVAGLQPTFITRWDEVDFISSGRNTLLEPVENATIDGTLGKHIERLKMDISNAKHPQNASMIARKR